MFSGIVPVLKAYVFDTFPEDEVPSVLAYREAAGTMAFVIGPILGGWLASELHFASPLFFASGAGVVAAVIAGSRLRDPNKMRRNKDAQNSTEGGSEVKPARPESVTLKSEPRPVRRLVPLLILSFIWACVRTCFHTYFPLMLSHSYNMSTSDMGRMLTFVALLAVCVQAGAFEQIRKKIGVRHTLLAGGGFTAAGLLFLGAFMGYASRWSVIVASGMYGIGVALMSPAMPALLMQAVPTERRGTLLGFESLVVNFGRILAPPIFGLFALRSGLVVSALVTWLGALFAWFGAP